MSSRKIVTAVRLSSLPFWYAFMTTADAASLGLPSCSDTISITAWSDSTSQTPSHAMKMTRCLASRGTVQISGVTITRPSSFNSLSPNARDTARAMGCFSVAPPYWQVLSLMRFTRAS
uniref:Secreted protein n=1 Tax=Vitrella brassicaformis TaxID=1169539 RepID=A0A7S1P8B0_9ALVE